MQFSSDYVTIIYDKDFISDEDSQYIENMLNTKTFLIQDNNVYGIEGLIFEANEINVDSASNVTTITYNDITATILNNDNVIQLPSSTLFSMDKFEYLRNIYMKLFSLGVDMSNDALGYLYSSSSDKVTIDSIDYEMMIDLLKMIYSLIQKVKNDNDGITDDNSAMDFIISNEKTTLLDLSNKYKTLSNDLYVMYAELCKL